MDFGDEFLFGVSTAAYQIEGAPEADGKLPSIWDEYCKKDGNIADGTSGDSACDHFNKWEEDLDLIKDLGFKCYRLSISWPRVINQDLTVNEEGIKFYEGILKGCQSRGIKPMVTLYHWDLPAWVQHTVGGWGGKQIVPLFEDYVTKAVERLKPYCDTWLTINEPHCIAELGYLHGSQAPGLKIGKNSIKRVKHNILLAHAKAYKAIKSIQPESKVSLAMVTHIPVAVNTESEGIWKEAYYELNDCWLGPLFEGRYREGYIDGRAYSSMKHSDTDLSEIKGTYDFIGLNGYCPYYFEATDYGFKSSWKRSRRTGMGWPIYHDTLYLGVKLMKEAYPSCKDFEVIITESGTCFEDKMVDGKVDDVKRVKYHQGYLKGIKKANDEGLKVIGYMAWSLLDNFEWSYGLQKRFGLVHVDYDTKVRTPKSSALYFKQLNESKVI